MLKHRWRKFILIYEWFVRTILFFCPDVPICMKLRGKLYSLFMQRKCKNLQVAHDVILRSTYSMKFGDNVYIANGCVILGGGSLEIGDNTLIGPKVVIATRKHEKYNGTFRTGKVSLGTIKIGRNCWIGANSVLVIDSFLPEGSILGAQSLLNKIFDEPDSLYAGIPARYIKKLNDLDD